jgi:hypothetical protein
MLPAVAGRRAQATPAPPKAKRRGRRMLRIPMPKSTCYAFARVMASRPGYGANCSNVILLHNARSLGDSLGLFF